MTTESNRPDGLPIDVDGALVRFESVSCNYCGSSDERELFIGPDRLLNLPGTFREVACRQCGLIRQNPRPTDETIGAYHPRSYEPYAESIRAEPHWWRRLDRQYGQVKRRRVIESILKSGTLLDVGSATGNFLAEMKKSGRWSVTGLEPSQHAAAYARQHHGLDTRTASLADANLPEGSFDVVTLWNVLEHVSAPIDDLRRVHRLLRPGGSIVFSIPNVESLEVRLFGARWIGWDLPRHLYIFPRDVLRRILADTGFELVRTECTSGSQLSFALTVRYLFLPQQERPWWHKPAMAILHSIPGRAVLGLPFYVFGRAGQSTIVTYVARKRAAN